MNTIAILLSGFFALPCAMQATDCMSAADGPMSARPDTSSVVTGSIPDYEYEALSFMDGVAGEKIIVTRCMCSDPSAGDDASMAASVHAILFNGCPSGNSLPAMKPMFNGKLTPEVIRYFSDFFESAKYRQYIKKLLVTNRKITKTKAKKKSYMVEMPVSVDVRKLRRQLENDGIIRSLGEAFE